MRLLSSSLEIEVVGGDRSYSKNFKVGWKMIWKLNVPSVVKVFIWKAANEVILTKSNLYKKKVIDNALCPICEQVKVLTGHVLRSCGATADVWVDSLSSLKKMEQSRGELHHLVGEDGRQNARFNIGRNNMCTKENLAQKE